MDALTAVFAGLGGLSFVLVLVASFFFFLVHPIWAFVDLAESRRERDAKILVGIALFFTWGLGSWIYGLFFGASALFKTVTRWGTLVFLVLCVVGVGACTLTAVRSEKLEAVEEQERSAALEKQIDEYVVQTIDIDAVSPFAALHYTTPTASQASLAAFNLLGPIASSAQSVESGVRQVAYDNRDKRFFSVKDHAFGSISSKTGRFSEIAVDSSIERLSWPKGVAYDSGSHQVVILTSHVFTRFYHYDPRKSEWALLPAEHRDFPVEALTYASDDETLYTIDASSDDQIERLHRFNRNGAHVGTIQLEVPIVLPKNVAVPSQLHYSSGHLMLIPPDGKVWVVDRTNGALSEAL